MIPFKQMAVSPDQDEGVFALYGLDYLGRIWALYLYDKDDAGWNLIEGPEDDKEWSRYLAGAPDLVTR